VQGEASLEKPEHFADRKTCPSWYPSRDEAIDKEEKRDTGNPGQSLE
jgi:hypothetical protein